MTPDSQLYDYCMTSGKPAGHMDGGSLPPNDKRRQQHRDDRLWRREEERASLYNLKWIHCQCCNYKGRLQLYIAKVKDHLIKHGREPNFRVWRGPGKRDGSDEEWEQEFKRPSRPHDGHIDERLDMHAMIEETFLEIDEAPTQHPTLEEETEDIIMGAKNATMWAASSEWRAVSGEQISWAENINLKLYFWKVKIPMTVNFPHIPRLILNVLRVMDSITVEIGQLR